MLMNVSKITILENFYEKIKYTINVWITLIGALRTIVYKLFKFFLKGYVNGNGCPQGNC